MLILFSISIILYTLGICIAALFNEKARLWVKGRMGQFDKLAETFKGDEHPVWVHSASMGEYEQARPLIEKIKREKPDVKVLVTFYSPSGYEIRKNDPLPDYIFYLPSDTRRHAKRFLQIVQPRMAIFIKYEFWYNYMNQLSERNIPFYYVSAIFRSNQYFFKPIGKWFAKQLRKASGFFVQNKESEDLLRSIGIPQVEICGDTRFDRVYAIATQPYTLDFVERFKQDRKLIVAGSTWGPDESLLAQLLPRMQGYKLIVAPHEITRKAEVQKTFSDFKTVLFTEATDEMLETSDVLIVDTIGMLSKIYKYSDISYIGGAFKTGLHNILEAAVFGVPLFFGPKYSHFNEAVMLVERKGAFSIRSSEEMFSILRHFEEESDTYKATCDICRQYVAENIGACDKIYKRIFLI
ncbi:MAG: 3-deoxy-D-manno-octulosonic acid transferase [Bacteroidales bacterium]|nr:3-deoxy-D-manno-octulosonic acid transferase [Bacteroidales bacterium]